MAEFRPDLVHLASPFIIGAYGLRSARKLGLPTVAIFQTDIAGFARQYPWFAAADRGIWRWVRRTHSRADRTLAPSTASVEALVQGGVPRVHLWGRGVNLDLFDPLHRDENWRREISPDGRPIVGYVGRLAAEKKVRRLAELTDLGCRIVIVGDGPDRASLENSLPDATFLGMRRGADLAAIFAGLDVFVHTGEHETFCQTIQEAQASGVATVGPAAGGPLDLIKPGENGLLFEPGSARIAAAGGQDPARLPDGPRPDGGERPGTRAVPDLAGGGRRSGRPALRRGPARGRSRPAGRVKGLRIAQLANFVGPTSGGMRTAIEHVGQGNVEAGAERIVITPGERDVVIETEFGTVVRMKAPKVGGGYRLITDPWKVIETLERFQPTTVEISDKSTLLPVARWARKNDIGSILFSHERLDAMLSLRTGRQLGVAAGVGALYKLLSRTYDAVVVTSRYAAAEFDEVTTPLVRIPLGVDLDTFHPSLAEPVDDGVLKLVHAGRLSREKSPHLAVATAAELYRRGVNLRMDVYGTGPHLDELLEIAGCAPVTFHGYVDGRRTLATHLAEADIALSVCPGETFGLAVLEALAAGTPVVTANTGGARELVDETCGRWAPANPAALAELVLQLAELPGRRAAARRRAELYDWNSCIHHMLALHTRLAERRLAA